ncbi:hypothetical protein [Intrasporangium sp. YIM S08009]|uniref:hypothetical protein n=1 Tax=Intrasporangium zincisolvens TaxID=3080018 RepID=UPI002B05D3C0|nr:hypothetical protein [Intrasporangium sp. YIM S08009]
MAVSLGVTIGALLAMGMAAWLATHGLDLTDEGLYLNAISHPADDRSTLLLFGFVYHPLYVMAGGDVVVMRWIGMGLSVLAMAALSWVAMGTKALVGHRPLRLPLRVAVSAGVGATALATVAQMPMSPGYNSLTLQGLAAATAGLVLAVTRHGIQRKTGAVLVGLGGWLTFMGKPTTAAALAAIVIVTFLALPGRWRSSMWMAPVAAAAAGGLSLAVFSSGPGDLVTVLSNGVATSQALGGHDSLIRRDPFLGQPTTLALLVLAGALAVGAALVAARLDQRKGTHLRGTRAAALVLLLVLLGVLGVCARAIVWRWGQAPVTMALAASDAAANLLLGSGVAITAVAGALAWAATRQPRRRAGFLAHIDGSRRTHLTLVGALLCMPLAQAFGTNVNLWAAQGRAVSFWLLALSLLLVRHVSAPHTRLLWMTPSLVAVTLLIATLAASAAAPYRYAPAASATVETRVAGGSIRLTSADHQAAADLTTLARRLGFDERTRVLDLTGDSPGSIFVLGARAVGQGWIIGGYRGSESAARLAIDNDRCNVQGAYLLVSPSAPRAIPTRVLTEVGRALDRDYDAVGVFSRARPSVGAAPRVEAVTVYRPRATAPRLPCSK